jgi:hypothetical protein
MTENNKPMELSADELETVAGGKIASFGASSFEQLKKAEGSETLIANGPNGSVIASSDFNLLEEVDSDVLFAKVNEA